MSKELFTVKDRFSPKREQQDKVLLRVMLQRHGPKASPVGEKNILADDFETSVREGFEEMGLREGDGLVRVASSPVSRAVETAEIDTDLLQQTDHRGIEHAERNKDFIPTKNALETPFQPEYTDEGFVRDFERIVVLQEAFLHTFQDTYVDELILKNRIDTEVLKILFDVEKVQEYGFEHTSKEIAEKLAKRYQHFLAKESLLQRLHDTSSKQLTDEPYVQIDVTHSFSIMSLLKEYLVFADGSRANTMTGEEFLEQTGGVIPESASLELLYKEGGILEVKGEFFPGKTFTGFLEFKD